MHKSVLRGVWGGGVQGTGCNKIGMSRLGGGGRWESAPSRLGASIKMGADNEGDGQQPEGGKSNECVLPPPPARAQDGGRGAGGRKGREMGMRRRGSSLVLERRAAEEEVEEVEGALHMEKEKGFRRKSERRSVVSSVDKRGRVACAVLWAWRL